MIKMMIRNGVKILRSPGYNYNFDMKTGVFMRWGTGFSSDPVSAPFPEILDIEVTEVCAGPSGRPCSFCYKSNVGHRGRVMSFDTFKSIIDKMSFLTQIAFGADAQATSNPDLFRMMEYSRKKRIIPNITVADISDETAKVLAGLCGAISVSIYKHAGFDVGFDTIERLTKYGANQINIHYMVSEETVEDTYPLLDAIKTDPRLRNVNAVVFLGLKQKGRGKRMSPVARPIYKKLIEYCMENGITYGFDSCSAPAFISSIVGHENEATYRTLVEDCESTLFSSYIDVAGMFYPCSFTEGEGTWNQGIDVVAAESFIDDVWNHPRTVGFRNRLIENKDDNGCRNCPVNGVDMRLPEFNKIDIEVL